MPTFCQAAYQVHENKSGKWSRAYAKKWFERLDRHAVPVLGDRKVDTIKRRELAAILSPLCHTHGDTVQKLRQAFHQTFRWAVANDYRTDNPADDALGELLPEIDREVEHRKALHHSEVPGAIRAIRESEAWDSTKLCFEWLILTAARSWEARGATWGEIDLDARLWVIPASRMKMSRCHKVPLSIQARYILDQARELYRKPTDEPYWPPTVPPNGLVFPHPGLKNPLSENALIMRAKKSDLGCVPHGFRASFMTWAQVCSGARFEAIELSLAHAVGTSVQRAYERTDCLDERRALMKAWADHCDPLPF
jgi:integrase